MIEQRKVVNICALKKENKLKPGTSMSLIFPKRCNLSHDGC